MQHVTLFRTEAVVVSFSHLKAWAYAEGAGEGHGPPLNLREKHKNILNIKKNYRNKKKEKKKNFNSLGFQICYLFIYVFFPNPVFSN